MRTLVRSIIAFTLLLSFAGQAPAQVLTPTNVPLHPWSKGLVPGDEENGKTVNREPVPYTHVREADVMWSQRVWETLDLREKINHPLYYPVIPVRDRKSFTQTLWDAVVTEQVIQAYKDEDFTEIMTPEEILAKTTTVDTVWIYNSETDTDTPMVIQNKFDPSNVKQLRIVEDWFFDRERSVMDVRIMGLALITEEYIDNPDTGEREFQGVLDVFWVYFPEARKVFAKNEVFNRFNDAERMSYDDLFFRRMFSSYIIKKENVYDRMISEYKKGLDALIESEDIKNELLNFEHDMWEF